MSVTKKCEGLRLKPYRDVAGVWTVGYGHAIKAGESFEPITEAQATELLRKDIAWAEHAVEDLVQVTLTQGQFDALVDFTFNLGIGTLKHSTLLSKLNQGDFEGAAEELGRFVNAGGRPQKGLIRRRKAELALWHGESPEAALNAA